MGFGDCSTGSITEATQPCVMVNGLERNLYILPSLAYNRATVVKDTDEIYIRSITLLAASGDEAFKFTMLSGQVKRAMAGERGDDSRVKYPPTIVIKLEDNAVNQLTIDALANNECVIILEQKQKGTNKNAAFVVYGSTAGLLALPTMEDDNNEITVTFTNLDTSKESHDHVFFSTGTGDTYDADVTALEALRTPA